MEPLKKKMLQKIEDNSLRDYVGGEAFTKLNNKRKPEKKNQQKVNPKTTPPRDLDRDTLGMAPPSGLPKDPWRS